MDRQKFGENIRNIREEKGLTQLFVSKKLGYKSSSMLSEIESGAKGLDAHKVPKLAEILGVGVEKLFFEKVVHDSRIYSKAN